MDRPGPIDPIADRRSGHQRRLRGHIRSDHGLTFAFVDPAAPPRKNAIFALALHNRGKRNAASKEHGQFQGGKDLELECTVAQADVASGRNAIARRS